MYEFPIQTWFLFYAIFAMVMAGILYLCARRYDERAPLLFALGCLLNGGGILAAFIADGLNVYTPPLHMASLTLYVLAFTPGVPTSKAVLAVCSVIAIASAATWIAPSTSVSALLAVWSITCHVACAALAFRTYRHSRVRPFAWFVVGTFGGSALLWLLLMLQASPGNFLLRFDLRGTEWMLFAAIPLFATGRIVSYAALFLAIVSDKSEQLEQANARLEALLDQRQLLVESLLNNPQTSSLGMLSSSLIHELSQSLAAVRLNAEQAHAMTPGSDEVSDIVADIATESRRASDAVHALRNTVPYHAQRPASLSLDGLAEDAIATIRPTARRHGVTLDVHTDSGIRVSGTAAELQQVIINLLNNAVTAVRSPGALGKHVTLAVRRDDAAALIVVRDRGPGVSAQVAPWVFDLFRPHRPPGMGYGLWLSKLLTERHGGRLDYRNEPDGGAVFTVRLDARPDGMPAES